jgi:hypothetical protein
MMRHFLSSLFFLIVFQGLNAQDNSSWKLILNKKNLITSFNVDDSNSNVIEIKKADLSNNGVLKIEYVESAVEKARGGWMRSIALFDTTGEVIAKQDSVQQLAFYNKDVLRMIWNRKKMGVYTWSAPIDKSMAAVIRIRRYRLCTLVLID